MSRTTAHADYDPANKLVLLLVLVLRFSISLTEELNLFESFKNNITVEPRFNEPLFNEVLDITNDVRRPGQSYSKMYGIEPRYNEPLYNEFFDITNIIRKPEGRIYLDITNYVVNTQQKINAELINRQQIL